jgi:hypothetical protein
MDPTSYQTSETRYVRCDTKTFRILRSGQVGALMRWRSRIIIKIIMAATYLIYHVMHSGRNSRIDFLFYRRARWKARYVCVTVTCKTYIGASNDENDGNVVGGQLQRTVKAPACDNVAITIIHAIMMLR